MKNINQNKKKLEGRYAQSSHPPITQPPHQSQHILYFSRLFIQMISTKPDNICKSRFSN